MNKLRKSFALCASVVTTFMHGSAEKIYKFPIFWELPQSQEPQAPDLWHMSGAKPLRRIFPKDVSGVVQDPSDQWDPVGWSCGITNIHKISRFKISVLMCYIVLRKNGQGVMRSLFVLHLPCKIDVHVPCLPHGITHLQCARPGEITITSSRPNQPMPRKTTRTFLLRECTINAKPRSWTHWPLRPHQLLHTLPVTPRPRSFRELFCCKIPEKDVTKAWSKVMWNSHRILTRKILTHNFSPIQTSRPYTSHPQTSHKQTSIYLNLHNIYNIYIYIPTITIFVSLHALVSSAIL